MTLVQASVDEYMATGCSHSRSRNPTMRALEVNAGDSARNVIGESDP
jgi:hypothetical protein